MTLCANRSFCGDLGETFLLDSLLILLRSGSFLDTVVAQNSSSSYMKLSYHPPQVKKAKVIVCPHAEVIVEGVAQWSNCLVGYFLDKKLPFIGVQNIATQIWKKFGIQKVMSNEQGFYFFEFSQADAARRVIEATPWHFGNDLIENRRRLSYAKNCVEMEVGFELPDSVDVECMGELVTVGIKPKAPPVGVGQSPVLRGSNSFSALALINQENLRIEDEVDEMLDMFDHPTSVLNPELDVRFIPVAKKTRGRGNAKAVLPGGKKGNKGGGCGLKA
ncbi:hypothetical protein RHSIM_Rhsim12G0066300 [Rhododendron simsii]|uniref:DUF4283 domain-containing protein n=1 Tax=Rhododendron simsii TaxID=118357 RepID=A0A834G1Y0_RHOSS|nr:hypothetical protein RHSIM_Rhsim12G0066300 [Rhododendron simsii]